MSVNLPPHPRRTLPVGLRLAFILLGIFILLWLPVEDRSVVLVLLIAGIATILCVLALLHLQQQRWAFTAHEGDTGGKDRRRKRILLWYPLAGMLAGAGVTLLAIALMAIKTGVHGHGAPDYLPEQVSLVLGLAPLWVCLGLTAGLVAAVWRR